MDHQHAVIWIDHREARLLKFGLTGSTAEKIHSHAQVPQVHHKANSIADGRAPFDAAFFDHVAKALGGLTSIVVTGPSSAKTELARYLREKYPAVAKAVVGIEPLDHPSDGELLAFAKEYLRAADRLRHA
ncbi:MAG: translational machinery protein [Pseudolabrys sp.]|nr:translational machinery protein [Pseudolabrys sp.]MBV9956601.1 translational machinery protein [Pseudolabrys sp.]